MIVNIDLYELEQTIKDLNQYLGAVASFDQDLAKKLYDSSAHMKTQKGAIANKVNDWKRKQSHLEQKKRDLEQRIAACKTKLEAKIAERNRIQRELASLRPPQKMTRTYTDENGNRHTETYISDPDGPRRNALEAELRRVEAEIAKLQAELSKLQAELAVILDDAQKVRAYLEKLEKASKEWEQASYEYNAVSKYAKDAASTFQFKGSRILSAVTEMESHLSRYNAKDYRSCSGRGSRPSIQVPNLHKTAFTSNYAPSSTARRSYFVSDQPDKDEKKKPPLPAKMKLVDGKEDMAEIVGVYQTREELAKDMAVLPAVLGRKHTLCVKKPITNATPCFANIKELSDFMSEKGYHGKMTMMGTRYTDPEGRIHYFN